MDIVELRPCPFCGDGEIEQEQTITDATVICCNCGCRTGFVFLGANEAGNASKMREQRDVWNTRTDPYRSLLEETEENVERVGRTMFDLEWANYPTPPVFNDSERNYWLPQARAILKSIREAVEKR